MTVIQENPSRRQIAAYRPTIRKASKNADKHLRRIKRALKEGEHHKARRLLKIYLTNRDAKISAAKHANVDLNPDLRCADRDLIALAEELNVKSSSTEPVEVFRKRKPDGRTFLHRGRDAAVKQLISHVTQEDWSWIIELDIRDFYSSIDRELLAEVLPIEREIFDTVITCERSTRLVRNNRSSIRALTGYNIITALQGLPPGAITSSLAADMYVTYMLRDLPAGFSIVNYGDNFFLGAKTKHELIQKIGGLYT